MLKKSVTLLLVSTMLTAGAAGAQTGSSSSSASSTSSSAPMNGKFVTEQTQGEFRASKFIGLNVYGADNQKVGDINEILIDRTGSAKAAVIGVGGFLGIGEKNVAVPFSSLEWVNERPQSSASATGGSSNTASSSSASSGTAATVGTGASTVAGAGGTTASASSSNRSPADAAASNGYPDHAVLRLTKDDLQKAPTFKYYADAHSGSGSNASGATGSSAGGAASGGAGSSAGTAPRQ